MPSASHIYIFKYIHFTEYFCLIQSQDILKRITNLFEVYKIKILLQFRHTSSLIISPINLFWIGK